MKTQSNSEYTGYYETPGTPSERRAKQLYQMLSMGYILLGFSLAMFLYVSYDFSAASANDLFIMCYCLAILFFLVNISFNWRRHGLSVWNYNSHLFNISVALFYISAFALNLEVHLFQPFPWWLTLYLLLAMAAFLAYPFRRRFPQWLQQVLTVLLGAGILLHFYMALYLLPTYFIGVIGIIFLGIGSHVFVSLFAFVRSVRMAVSGIKNNKLRKQLLFTGIGLPLFLAIIFITTDLFRLAQLNNLHEEYYDEHSSLPFWVYADQRKEDARTWIANRMEISRNRMRWDGDWLWFGRNSGTEHNPLHMITASLGDAPNMQGENFQELERNRFTSRTEFGTRLWSGEDLITSSISTHLDIFPEYRMAYWEKTFRISNNSHRGGSQQEALYTFYLPRGAMATSLSLWVNGVERKSRITTRQKAGTAYNNIVGRERRDPAVMHWQEGNRVSVSVFPCTPEEERQFKVGFTVPMRSNGQNLVLENIYFQGPEPDGENVTTIAIPETADPVAYNFAPEFVKVNKREWVRTERMAKPWKVLLPLLPLSEKPFSFDGNTYKARTLLARKKEFDPDKVYLDLNQSWTADEFERVWQQLQGKHIMVAGTNGFEEMTQENRFRLFGRQRELRYSLFPFYLLKDPAHSLVITKNDVVTPVLSNLKGTAYMTHTVEMLNSGRSAYVLDLSTETSPYISSLAEFGGLHHYQANLQALQRILDEKWFPEFIENNRVAAIPAAEMSIVRTREEKPGNAPDHLMRVFASRQVMRQLQTATDIGKLTVDDALVSKAVAAHVVTPVTSLVTLETDHDYDRFDIKAPEPKKQLGNATNFDLDFIGGGGATPEPHEWALIIFGAIVLINLILKRFGITIFPF